MRSHFRRFTDVQPETRPEVTRKSWNFFETADCADGFPRWRLTQTPYSWILDSTRRVPQWPDALPFLYPLSAQSVVNFFSARVHGCFSSQSFWKRGSFRSGSNMGSSRSSAGVSGALIPIAPP